MKAYEKDMRKNKGLTEPIYLVEVSDTNSGDYERQFIVMGTKEKEYKVKIKEKPTCTCMDYIMRAKHSDYFCKHIYFIVKRALKCSDQICDKKKFTKKHLTELFSMIDSIPQNTMYNADPMKIDDGTPITHRKPIGDEDACPICLDELFDGNDLVYCMLSCGNSIHKTCFEMWSKKKGEKLCVFCRGTWKQQLALTKEKVIEELMKIASALSMSIDPKPIEENKNNNDQVESSNDLPTNNLPTNNLPTNNLPTNNISVNSATSGAKDESKVFLKPVKAKKALEFFTDVVVEKLLEIGVSGKKLTKEISTMWKTLSDEDQQKYIDLGDKDQERFDEQSKDFKEKGYYISKEIRTETEKTVSNDIETNNVAVEEETKPKKKREKKKSK